MIKKGVILAGGNATRLFPLTKYVNKHLLPIYNKPMIHRSIIFLRELGINEILIICNLKDIKTFEIVKKQFRDLKSGTTLNQNDFEGLTLKDLWKISLQKQELNYFE